MYDPYIILQVKLGVFWLLKPFLLIRRCYLNQLAEWQIVKALIRLPFKGLFDLGLPCINVYTIRFLQRGTVFMTFCWLPWRKMSFQNEVSHERKEFVLLRTNSFLLQLNPNEKTSKFESNSIVSP